MDKRLKNIVLKFLHQKAKTVTFHDVIYHCYSEYEVPEKDFAKKDEIKRNVEHAINVLTGENLIDNKGGDYSHLIWLTAEGYKEFEPWYKKFWNFINNDFAKLLSLIAIILSIIATAVSLSR